MRPTRERRYSIADGRGLSIEVYPTGGMAWRYRYRVGGRLEKVAIGKYPAISLKEVRQRCDELATVVAKGASPARLKQLRKVALAEETTVRDFGKRYFTDVVSRDRKDTKTMR